MVCVRNGARMIFQSNITNVFTLHSPYCEEFLAETLWPAFQDLGTKVMNVTVIPFGNAHVDEDTKTVQCQHGGGKLIYRFVNQNRFD